MIIQLSPQGPSKALSIQKRGDVLIINDERFDFSQIPEGAVLPASAVNSEFVVGDVTRLNGELKLTILLPLGPEATAAGMFPADIVNPPDGNVSLPQ